MAMVIIGNAEKVPCGRPHEAYWQAFRRHEGMNSSRYEVTSFKTPREVAESLLELMIAGVMRATASPMPIFGPRHEEPVPEVGDYAVLLDTHNRPQLIWRTTGVSVGPLSAVTDRFIWQSGEDSGEREDWLARIASNFSKNGKRYGFEMHADIETVFETLEVVWPTEIARRVQVSSLSSGSGHLPAQEPERAATLRGHSGSRPRANSDRRANSWTRNGDRVR